MLISISLLLLRMFFNSVLTFRPSPEELANIELSVFLMLQQMSSCLRIAAVHDSPKWNLFPLRAFLHRLPP